MHLCSKRAHRLQRISLLSSATLSSLWGRWQMVGRGNWSTSPIQSFNTNHLFTLSGRAGAGSCDHISSRVPHQARTAAWTAGRASSQDGFDSGGDTAEARVGRFSEKPIKQGFEREGPFQIDVRNCLGLGTKCSVLLLFKPMKSPKVHFNDCLRLYIITILCSKTWSFGRRVS